MSDESTPAPTKPAKDKSNVAVLDKQCDKAREDYQKAQEAETAAVQAREAARRALDNAETKLEREKRRAAQLGL